MTKAWHDTGMEWHDEAWRGCDKLLQHQITETGKIKKKAPDGSEPDMTSTHLNPRPHQFNVEDRREQDQCQH